jgi:hypothetical protein
MKTLQKDAYEGMTKAVGLLNPLPRLINMANPTTNRVELAVEGREVWIEASPLNENPSRDIAKYLRYIADIVEKDGRIFDAIYLDWIKD